MCISVFSTKSHLFPKCPKLRITVNTGVMKGVEEDDNGGGCACKGVCISLI